MPTCIEPEAASLAAHRSVERSLTHAFACFTETAESLERSYRHLEEEVVRMRRELEERNAELAHSLEENLRMRDSLFKVLEGLPCGVLVAHPGGRLSLMNPAAVRLLGMSDSTLQDLSQLPSGMLALLDQARKNAGEWELQIGCASKQAHSIAVRHALLDHADRESVFILQDVSDRRRLAQEREHLERQQALGAMAAVLAHEIRNPLGSLELFAGLLAESDLQDDHRMWVENLQAGLRTLAATVNNVLHLHNLPCPQLVSTDLGELLGAVRDFLMPLAKQSLVHLDLDNRLHGIHMRADRHRLEQVLLNLIINGVRFVPPGGFLLLAGRVERSIRPPVAQIEVTDTGPGIPAEHLGKIFEAGYSTRPGSPGLGLTVCKTIVEQHGGSIRAANRPTGGARFLLSFPLREA